MSDDRTPKWDGAFNLLDLGGLPLLGGGATMPGRVFRSGRLETLTGQGWADLRDAGVTAVVDLRNEPERSRRPWDPLVSEDARFNIAFAHCPTEDPDDDEFQTVCGPWLDHPKSYGDNLRLFPAKIAAAFAAVAGATGATVIHCSGGRDRTGLICAMLLQLAGVVPRAIADDYACAFRTASRTVALHPELHRERAYSHEEIEVRIDERKTALRGWLGELDVEKWLLATGLSAAAVRSLQSRPVSSDADELGARAQ